jgi:hypothetical protein
MRYFLVLLLIIPSICYSFNPKTATLEEKMVFLNNDKSPSSIDQVKVNRFKSIFDSLQLKHPETRQEIADYTVKAQSVLKDAGISESLLEIAESMNNLKLDKRLGKISYKDLVISYVVVRTKGMSRADAVQGLHEFYRGIARTKK